MMRFATRFQGARAATVMLAALSAAVVAWSTAFAHGEPTKLSPGDGAVLASPPAEVTIEMSQEMARQAGANDIDVLDSTGKEITTGAAVIDNGNRKKISIALPASLVVGVYTVRWKTLSADDGDPAEGTFAFTYDPTKAPNPGKTVVREDLLDQGAGQGGNQESSALSGGDSGRSWTLVIAVAMCALVIGSGGTFLLMQKRS